MGAGFAGLAAAQRLARSKVSVTLIDRHNYHLFQPLLYQVATSGLNPSEITSNVRGNFGRYPNVRVIKASVTGVDRAQRQVICDDGALSFPYDDLILCAGGRTSYFGNDHWAEIAPGLKSLDDATAIRNRFLNNFERAELTEDREEICRLTSVVIIGGGPTGVELAGSFAELRSKVFKRDFRGFDPSRSKVTLLEGGPSLLAGYDAKLSAYTKKQLEKVGVEVKLDTRVTEITAEGVVTADAVFASANVIWAAGVEGHPYANRWVDQVTPRNAIVVQPDLTVPGEEHIYACGDLANFTHDERFPRGLPGVAQVAMQQGDLAARNILASRRGKPRQTFRYFDKGKMATIGRSAAVAEAKGLKMKGPLAWLAWLFIHVIYLVEFQDRVVVFLRWLWAYVTWHWGVRIIFPDQRGPAPVLAAPQPAEPSETEKPTEPEEPAQSAEATEPEEPAQDSERREST